MFGREEYIEVFNRDNGKYDQMKKIIQQKNNSKKDDILAAYLKALKTFEDEMVEYVIDNFQGEKGMSRREAAAFLDQSVKGWTQEDIDEAVEEVQREYFASGEYNFDELVLKYLELQ